MKNFEEIMASSNSMMQARLLNADSAPAKAPALSWEQLSKDGAELYKYKRLSKAKEKFEKAIELSKKAHLTPDAKAALQRNYARTCHQLREWEEAIGGYNEALKFQNDKIKRIKIIDEKTEAVTALTKEILVKINMQYKKREYKEAKVECEKVLSESKSLSEDLHCELRRRYAWMLYALNQKEAATLELKKALELAKDDATRQEIEDEFEDDESEDESLPAYDDLTQEEKKERFLFLSSLLEKGLLKLFNNKDGSVTVKAPENDASESNDADENDPVTVAPCTVDPSNPFGFR
jgi:tetratricopeptide (TPR) repeat protein